MTIAFDHAQYALDIRLILGESTSEVQQGAPFTDCEFYRAGIDPGFDGAITFLEADLYFDRYSSAIQNVTWKWQIMSKGQSTWSDLHTAVTEQWLGYAQSRLRVGLPASSLGVNTGAPFQMRLIATAASAATVKVRIGTYTPAVRVIGESS